MFNNTTNLTDSLQSIIKGNAPFSHLGTPKANNSKVLSKRRYIYVLGLDPAQSNLKEHSFTEETSSIAQKLKRIAKLKS